MKRAKGEHKVRPNGFASTGSPQRLEAGGKNTLQTETRLPASGTGVTGEWPLEAQVDLH